MVTIITKKLQEQSLGDLSCQHSQKLSQHVTLYPYEAHVESPWSVIGEGCAFRTETRTAALPVLMCPSGGAYGGLRWQRDMPSHKTQPVWIGEWTLKEPGWPPLAPPTKRHCRSLSEPDGLSHCRSPWRPGSGSKIWTPVSRRLGSPGGSASLLRSNSYGSAGFLVPSSPGCKGSLPHPFSLHIGALADSHPCSVSSGFVECTERSSGVSSSSSSSSSSSPCRRLSVSQEHLPDGSCSPSSSPELGRRSRLPRCRSQPCVLRQRKSGLKRRRDDDLRWSRPSLDFLKMTRTLKNSKSLCSLDDVSSERSANAATQDSDKVATDSESEGDSSDPEGSPEPLLSSHCDDLDLELIEKN